MPTSFNIWQPVGAVITGISGGSGQPNVLYEGNAKILSGTVFKMWYSNGNNVNYAESSDGLTWTQYSSNPVIAVGGIALARIYKNGSTYYAYAGIDPIKVYTSSDGVAWTLQNASAIVHTANSWENQSGFTGLGPTQLNVVDVVSGTWYGYYTATYSLTSPAIPYAMGLATSTDGINWTKYSGNPVITAGGPSNFFWQKVNGVYYGWSQVVIPGVVLDADAGLPSDITRFWSFSPSGPWTELSSSTYYRTTVDEGVGITSGQVADPSIVSDGTNLWFYYTCTNTGTVASYTIKAAKASNMTFAQLVATYEGVQNIPIMGNPSLNMNVLATDNFQRANGALGANWTADGNVPAAPHIASQLVQPTTAGQSQAAYYTGINWASFADQWSEVTVNNDNNAAGTSYVGTTLRENASKAGYFNFWSGGSAPGYATVTPSFGSLSPTAIPSASQYSFPTTVGDKRMFCVIGTNFYIYLNGILSRVGADTSTASGNPGMWVNASTAATNAQISLWRGGGFQDAPFLSASISGNAGVGAATVAYSGTASGSVVADSFGNYILPNLVIGSYTITPSLTGYTFSPSSSNQTVSGTNITGVNFTASSGANVYSVPDCRVAPFGPNSSRTVAGTKIYDVQTGSNSTVPGTDSRAAGAPVDCRISPNIPQNSRTPGTFGPGVN